MHELNATKMVIANAEKTENFNFMKSLFGHEGKQKHNADKIGLACHGKPIRVAVYHCAKCDENCRPFCAPSDHFGQLAFTFYFYP